MVYDEEQNKRHKIPLKKEHVNLASIFQDAQTMYVTRFQPKTEIKPIVTLGAAHRVKLGGVWCYVSSIRIRLLFITQCQYHLLSPNRLIII